MNATPAGPRESRTAIHHGWSAERAAADSAFDTGLAPGYDAQFVFPIICPLARLFPRTPGQVAVISAPARLPANSPGFVLSELGAFQVYRF